MIRDPGLTRLTVQLVGYEQLTMFGESELAAELYCDEQLESRDLTGPALSVRLDTQGSVSALDEDEGATWDDELLENQFQRNFHEAV